MTAVMSMPFGWPAWLVNVCFWLKQLVAFDFPGLAAPECAAEMSPAELVLVRVGVTAVILPVVWFVVLVQMVVVAKCTKMGRRKVRRGVSLFGEVRNALGRRYATFGTFSEVDEIELEEAPGASNPRAYGPGAPRRWQVGIRARF